MKTKELTPQQRRHRKFLVTVPLLIIPLLTLFFWAFGGGAVGQRKDGLVKTPGLNMKLPSPNLRGFDTLDKMSFYNRATRDSAKFREEQKQDPYSNQANRLDTSTLHFPFPGKSDKVASGAKNNVSQSEDQVNQKIAQLQRMISNPQPETKQKQVNAAISIEPGQRPVTTKTSDPYLQQMNGLLEKILDIQHPERIKSNNTSAATPVKKFRAIPAAIDGTQKVFQGTVICLKLLDSVTIGGQLFAKGQRLYGNGSLANQRYSVTIKSIHVDANFYPVDLTVLDAKDGMDGISVPEAVTADAVRDGADNGIQTMQLMSLDESVGAQAAAAGVNAAKGLFSKKIKRVKAKIKDGHLLLLRDNQSVRGLSRH